MDFTIFKSFSPEIFLSLCIVFQLLFNVRFINNNNYPILDREIFFQVFFILSCLLLLFLDIKIEGFLSNFLFLNDHGTRSVKILTVLSSLISLIVIYRSFVLQNLNFFEFFTLFLFSLLSLLILVSSHDLISSYLAIEMQALCFYILSSFKRDSAFSTEAGLKYFISGSFISGIFLFGISILYGSLGTLNLNSINLLLSFPFDSSQVYLYYSVFLGVVLVSTTFFFKISAAPFHFWSPDVYDGSPLSSTVIFAIIPKIAIVSFFIKWIISISIFFANISNLFLFVGIFSTFLGTMFALRQKRFKKVVIYSSIAQVGFIVSALSINNLEGFISIYFFLIIYIVTSILIWGHISTFYSFQLPVNLFYNQKSNSFFLSQLSNLFKLNSLWSLSFILIFFSIAGIPPLCGFLSKVFILLELIKADNIVNSLILILISAISVFYYLRIIKISVFESKEALEQTHKMQMIFYSSLFDLECITFVFCLFFLVIFFLYPSYLLLISQYIILSFSFF